MKGSNRLILFGAAGLIVLLVLGLVLQAIRNLLWDLSYILPPWLVGPVLLIGTILVIAFVVQVGWPVWKGWKSRRGATKAGTTAPLPPGSRRQAAEQSLESIDRLLERLQDDVARQALHLERERVARELARGDLVVVVFGTGSSGKTSLIRALLQDIVGKVGAPMGSTTGSQTYRLRLNKLERGLQLVDTPGILESGLDGRDREQEARERAGRADLMLVVVDGDLRSAEWDVVRSLAGLGKRLMLVLNNAIYGERRRRSVLWPCCADVAKACWLLRTSSQPVPLPNRCQDLARNPGNLQQKWQCYFNAWPWCSMPTAKSSWPTTFFCNAERWATRGVHSSTNSDRAKQDGSWTVTAGLVQASWQQHHYPASTCLVLLPSMPRW